MPYDDLRSFLDKLDEVGELVHVKQEVDWNQEAGAIVRRTNELGQQAVLFENVKDYPNWRLAGALMSNIRRVSVAMDMPSDSRPRQLVTEFLRRTSEPIRPVKVDSGPCKENIITGDKVDLFSLPAPYIHEGDGGRYILTWHAIITKDPDSDWVNWGMYRGMIHDKSRLGILAQPQQQIGKILYQKYEPRNQPMDVAIAIGMEPISSFCAATFFPVGVNEVDMAGAIRGKPVELVRAETVDLWVPATAELIIEGKVRPGVRQEEGPFGEYTGYRASDRMPRPVVEVTAITHRNNPILTMSCEGIPTTETHASMSITKSAEMERDLRARGFPITGVWNYPESANQLIVVATKVPYANTASAIAHAIYSTPAGIHTPYLIVVQDDVDPYNWAQVMHALATRCHPYRGVRREEFGTTNMLDPRISLAERRLGMGAKAYFDCTWPVDWAPDEVPQLISFDTAYSEGTKEKVLRNWSEYGFQKG